jgi:integrase
MGVYKDEKNGTWFVKCYYTDYTGTRKQKMKRGFSRQKDAKEWERQFLEQQQGSPDMSFSAMCELFLEDKKAHAKLSSYKSEKGRLEAWVIPYFRDKPLSSITAADIRKWQAELKTATGANGEPLSQSYLHNIVMECSAVFNFAVKYYGLSKNPCRIAGDNIGKKVKSVQFWTHEEFKRFIATFDKPDPFYTAFLVLYYTGMRIGELMALTFADVDLKAGTISINKTYHKIDGRTVITPPKTEKGNRTITIPQFLCDCLERHMKRIYGATSGTRLFSSSKNPYLQHMKKHEALAGLHHIRLHDLRHSHASLLIELGFSALLVSERLGHENVSTTLDIYSHLFPSKQSEVADKLNRLYSSDNY